MRIPGQVRPIIYSDARKCVLFWTEIPFDEPPDGAGHVFLLNCRTFELYTYDATRAKHAPDTVEEIVLLVATALMPKSVPMVKLKPNAEGGRLCSESSTATRLSSRCSRAIFSGTHRTRQSRTRSSYAWTRLRRGRRKS
jgi:hypothetical protein